MSKYIYTKDEAINEIMDIRQRHISNDRFRQTKFRQGDLSTQSKAQSEARDAKEMRELLESFFKT